MMPRVPNHCVHATSDCAFLFIVAQVSGTPDAFRSGNAPIRKCRITPWCTKKECCS